MVLGNDQRLPHTVSGRHFDFLLQHSTFTGIYNIQVNKLTHPQYGRPRSLSQRPFNGLGLVIVV
jgi:hypothetical protein